MSWQVKLNHSFLSLQPINTHTFNQYQQYEWSFYDKREVEVLSFNISHGFCADTIKGYNICFNQTQVTRINNYIFAKLTLSIKWIQRKRGLTCQRENSLSRTVGKINALLAEYCMSCVIAWQYPKTTRSNFLLICRLFFNRCILN